MIRNPAKASCCTRTKGSMHLMLLVMAVQLFNVIMRCEAFSPASVLSTKQSFVGATTTSISNTKLSALPPVAGTLVEGPFSSCDSPSFVLSSMSAMDFTSMEVSAATLDPTTVLSDLFAGLLGTPAILLVPILAALGVAGLIAFFIVSYANPEVEDDE